MGVFARLFRRSKATEEASAEGTQAAEVQADTAEAEPTEEKAAGAADESGVSETKGSAKAESECTSSSTCTSSSASSTATSSESEDAVEEAAENPACASSEGVEIPKQQSAGEAADSEADEGART